MTNKQTILQTALKLFGDQGYDRTPTSQIAREASVSEGLIFRHFGNKAGLLEAIIQEGLAQVAATMAPYLQTNPTPKDAILQHIELALTAIRTDEQFWRLATKIRFQSAADDAIGAQLKLANQFIVQQLTDNFRRLGAEQPAEEALLLFALIDGICLHWLQAPKDYPLEIMKNRLLQRYADQKL